MISVGKKNTGLAIQLTPLLLGNGADSTAVVFDDAASARDTQAVPERCIVGLCSIVGLCQTDTDVTVRKRNWGVITNAREN